MVRIYSPSSLLSSAGALEFGGPGFHEPPPPPPALGSAAPYRPLDHHQPHHFGGSAFGEPMIPLLPVHGSAAPHLFHVGGNRAPPPPPPRPPFHGHRQQFSFPPPPPPSQGGLQRQSLRGLMHFLPPAREGRAPSHGQYDSGPHPQPPTDPPPSLGHRHPPPLSHGHGHGLHGHPQGFMNGHVVHEPVFSPPLAHRSNAPDLFVSRNGSPPPSPASHGHHKPLPFPHSRQPHPELGRSRASPEVTPSPPPGLEPAAPNMFMSHKSSPPPPPLSPLALPHLHSSNHSPSHPPAPHGHNGSFHHARRLGRPPALGNDAHYSHMDLFHDDVDSPPPPPLLMHSHPSLSSPFQLHAAKCCMQPPMGPPEADAVRHMEPLTRGPELHPPHQSFGGADRMSDNGHEQPCGEERPRPYLHKMRKGHHDHDQFSPRGRNYVLHARHGVDHHHEFGAADHGCKPPIRLHSPKPPQHRRRPIATPLHPRSFCAPLVPTLHLSNAIRPHFPMPVW